MKSRNQTLADRRAELMARCEAQRAELGFWYRRLEAPVKRTEAAVNRITNLVCSPLMMAGVAGLFLGTRWRRWGKLSGWIWRGWRLFQFLNQVRRRT